MLRIVDVDGTLQGSFSDCAVLNSNASESSGMVAAWLIRRKRGVRSTRYLLL
jgi:hypothetical protein